MGGRDCQYIRTQREFMYAGHNKPSVLVLPVPLDETVYHYPLHATNGDIYRAEERLGNVPLFKHSMALTYQAMAGFDSNWIARAEARYANWDFHNEGLVASHVWHHSWGAYMNAETRSIGAKAGTGPLGDISMHHPRSAGVWAGIDAVFAKEPVDYNMYNV
jgi:hypothetical protein